MHTDKQAAEIMLPKRIEVESLLPGDVFEYEHVEWGILYEGPGRFGTNGTMQKDADGKIIKGQRRTMMRDTVRRQAGRFERRNGIRGSVQSGKTWWDHQDAEAVQREMTYVATVTGQNNHGYVVLRPKTVVLLIERTTTEWAVRTENGQTALTDEVTARRAVTEGGWTIRESPVVAALTRPDADSEWQTVDPSTSPGVEPKR